MFPGLYMLNTDVLFVCFPSKITVVHLPNPCGSSPLVMIAKDMFSSTMIAVPPGLKLLFQGSDEFEVH